MPTRSSSRPCASSWPKNERPPAGGSPPSKFLDVRPCHRLTLIRLFLYRSQGALTIASPGLNLVSIARTDTSRDAGPASVLLRSQRRGECDGRRGSGGEVVLRLRRSAPARRRPIQPQVGEDLLGDLPLGNGCDDLEMPAAAVRAVLHVDVEGALEQPCPVEATGPRLGGTCGCVALV